MLSPLRVPMVPNPVGGGVASGEELLFPDRATRGSSRSPGKAGFLDDPFVFHDGVDKISSQLFVGFFLPTWPKNLSRDIFFRPQTKMQSQIVLRAIARTAPHFAELTNVARGNRHPSADCGFVAPGPDQAKQHCMILILRAVDQQRGSLPNIQE